MPDENSSSWFQILKKRLFGRSIVEDIYQEKTGKDSPESRTEPGSYSPARNLAMNLSILKATLDLDDETRKRIDGLNNTADCLVAIHEILLSRLLRMKEIGFISPQSGEAIEKLQTKIEDLVSQTIHAQPDRLKLEKEKLEHENLLLKKQIKKLRSDYIKTGIITEREIKLEEECLRLRTRMKQAEQVLKIARERTKALAIAQDMVRTLQARCNLLNLRLNQQVRLINKLAEGSQQKSLVENIRIMEEENAILREQLARRSDLWNQAALEGAGEGTPGEQLSRLVKQRSALQAALDEKQEKVETLAIASARESLPESLMRLHDENTYLKSILEGHSLGDADTSEGASENMKLHQIIESLRSENYRLEQLIKAKTEHLRMLKQDPANRHLARAATQFKKKYRELEDDYREQQRLMEQITEENKDLKQQLDSMKVDTRRLAQLQAELDAARQTIASYQQLGPKYLALKKEHSALFTKYQAAVNRNQEMARKLSNLTAEYELMAEEYERIFRNLTE